MGLFSRKPEIEKRLEKMYSQMLQVAFPSDFARSVAEGLVAKAKEASRAEGTANLPPNMGDVLLERESSDPETHRLLEGKRREGVTDEDIRWWWNRDDLERRMMVAIDDFYRLAAFEKSTDEGSTQEEGVKMLRRNFPIFGDPTDTTQTSGEDRPLPYELKDRINVWGMGTQATDPQLLRKEVSGMTSMNALIRAEIRAGRL